ncbi:MAG TPA: 2-phospho-L-lactate guanylyltransferase [Thermoleophilaceae bacterium]|nr:2-phospho-L-lactate guanylyltransferase [Thermoleophilaceae bacterium]
MRTVAILPIKSFGAAKQRLAPMLGTGARQALAQAMFSDVLSSLRKVERIEAITVVSADPTVDAAARGTGVTVLMDSKESGQSDATQMGIRHAQAEGYDRVLLVPGDTPLLDPAELDLLLRRGETDAMQVVIVPDRHGSGTNALLISPPSAFRPSFGPDSLNRHLTLAQEAGLRHSVEDVPSLSHDVDTPDDLEALSVALEGRRAVAPMTRGALSQLDRARASRFARESAAIEALEV